MVGYFDIYYNVYKMFYSEEFEMKFKVKGKNKMFSIICFISLIMFFIYILLKTLTPHAWVNFYEHEKYKGFFDGKIKEIVLQKYFNTKVEFSDKNLIVKWKISLELYRCMKNVRNQQLMEKRMAEI